ncbi:hypothetical protein [Patulibacter sp.]|uniref:hypothetical protein n=1 Tax=Patulibacter sp. TaxID=1912859 RepID=UPI002724C647|nr:hypothetical protein [Patulibacter sp.]MDO9410214.1 hypothetical protein [Patulibacter sp.]
MTGIRAGLLADATTARRLRVRRGTLVATATVGRRRAGEYRLRLRVPAALRAKVRRATRITGTLRVLTTAAAGTASVSKRVTIKR